MVRPVAKRLYDCIMHDVKPDSMACLVDFGLDGWGGGDGEKRFEALYYPVRAGEISLEDLDYALGNGPRLTALVNKCKSNPHPGIVFATAYDGLSDEE